MLTQQHYEIKNTLFSPKVGYILEIKSSYYKISKVINIHVIGSLRQVKYQLPLKHIHVLQRKYDNKEIKDGLYAEIKTRLLIKPYEKTTELERELYA